MLFRPAWYTLGTSRPRKGSRHEQTGQGRQAEFVVNALVTQLVVAQSPGLVPLCTDLRYQVQTENVPDLPKLPLTTIAFSLPSFRPADDLILSATSLSGIPAFIELIDIDALSQLQDPVKARLEALLR